MGSPTRAAVLLVAILLCATAWHAVAKDGQDDTVSGGGGTNGTIATGGKNTTDDKGTTGKNETVGGGTNATDDKGTGGGGKDDPTTTGKNGTDDKGTGGGGKDDSGGAFDDKGGGKDDGSFSGGGRDDGNGCEKGGVDCNRGVTFVDVSACGQLLAKLQIAQTGAATTVFCPLNTGLTKLARHFNFASVDALIAGLDSYPNKAEVARVMQFHVVDPRKVYTKAGFVAATGGLSLTTLLTASDATKKLTVTQQTTSKGKLRIKVAGAGRDEDVLSFDLTFGGIYAGATTGFIVHAIEESLLRPNCTGCGGGGNGSGNSSSSSGIEDKPDGEYDKPSGKPVTAADVADCKRLLEAASISYEGSTVFCPTNKVIAHLAKAVGLKTTQALLDDMAKGPASFYLKWVAKVRARGGRRGPNSGSGASVLRFHVAVGVYPQYSLPTGTMEPLNTLQTPDDPSAVIKLFKGKSILFPFKLVVYVKNPVASEQAKVTRFNLTFAGDYDGSTSYVVHALNTPLLLPPGTFSTFDKFLFSLRTTTFYSARYFRPFIKKALKGNTAATLFLPLDSAWTALGERIPLLPWSRDIFIDSIESSKQLRETLAKYHYVEGPVTSGKVVTRLGQQITVDSPAVGKVTGALNPLNVATLKATYTVGYLTIFVIDGFPLLPVIL
ncbi:hypothetical protein MNEG_10527 [Monoraphidium neglectum]|uniref:FAS1 domain-containing protein n=1 Tax=Monoraphidium neglectum TaxID=145388 RepID=A0A0D2M168_9CHLO|nr:hypothetical protein MNEG_10527 [Monoraphidium neglectum]KIY97434.1 hypothetical protein MNEG_10527 [Monoraphidium neglectum]|eukprot:XP_013896454.1 hypothetical protein MNEG_10527 [Monoraphidium neglectum]